MKLPTLTQQQKESIKHLGILELFEGCDFCGYICRKCKNKLNEEQMGKRCPFCNEWTYNHIENIGLCKICKAKIQQTQKDFKREAEEFGKIVEFLNKLFGEEFDESEGFDMIVQNKINQLKSKQDALILASELEE